MRPDGLVDPYDAAEVTTVLAAALRTMGPEGVVDLLARVPGVRTEAARAKRFLSPAAPAALWLGPEQRLVLTAPIVHEHVVGGVVLARDPLPPGELPAVVARLLGEHTRREAVEDDAAVALTAVRDVAG